MDTGYSSLKGYYNGKYYKVPTSVSFSDKSNFQLGSSLSYDFEGKHYLIGDGSVSEDSFSTTDFKIKLKFEPLFIKFFRDKLEISDDVVCDVVLSLALVDWNNRQELIDRCSEFTVNDVVIKNNVKCIPQGIGSYADFKVNKNSSIDPSSTFLIDIGYNTINAIYIEEGKVVPTKSKGYPNHGVSSVIKKFTNYLESTYSLPFSEQEAIKIFISNKFIYQGKVMDDVTDKISEYKSQFISTLFNSILVADKKLLSTSEKVVLSGGGTYFLKDTQFPENVILVDEPYEFSNCKGMVIMEGLE
jgi:hypothetical protein